MELTSHIYSGTNAQNNVGISISRTIMPAQVPLCVHSAMPNVPHAMSILHTASVASLLFTTLRMTATARAPSPSTSQTIILGNALIAQPIV